ncbi:MAG: DUF3726 domain-containing protein [Pseudomonadota bacterium]
MRLSLNEAHALARDAARGAGVSWGEAGEIADAMIAREVIRSGFGSPASSAHADKGFTAAAELVQRPEQISLLLAARDQATLLWLQRDRGALPPSMHLAHPVDGCWLFLLLAEAINQTGPSRPAENNLSLTAQSADEAPAASAPLIIFPPTGTPILSAQLRDRFVTDQAAPEVAVLTLAQYDHATDAIVFDQPALRRAAVETGLPIARPALKLLKRLAGRTLVPASERSRRRGAGAEG